MLGLVLVPYGLVFKVVYFIYVTYGCPYLPNAKSICFRTMSAAKSTKVTDPVTENQEPMEQDDNEDLLDAVDSDQEQEHEQGKIEADVFEVIASLAPFSNLCFIFYTGSDLLILYGIKSVLFLVLHRYSATALFYVFTYLVFVSYTCMFMYGCIPELTKSVHPALPAMG